MDVCEAKRLKQLEDENAKLKKLLAEQMLDAAALRELLSKNGRARRQARRRRASSGHDGPVGTAGLLDRPLTARWSVTAHAGRQTRSFGGNCAISPTRGSVSDIVGCSSCCGRRASPRASTHLPALSRRRPYGSQATGTEARRGVAGADPGRIQAERSLVGGFRP